VPRRLATAVIALAAAFALPAPAVGGEPPNQNDPCSVNGRNVCGTTGVGSYETYRYGIRWFGDYRGAVPGFAHTYCIDLRYWYPSRDYRFQEDTSETLRNRDGEVVSLERQRRIAYAVWASGRTSNRTQAAAVMLYVHGLMGDAAPGEAAPDAIGPAVAAVYARVAADAERYHGPYRIETRLPDRLRAGVRANGTLRVLSASGNALPGVQLQLASSAATGLPASVTTNANGIAAFAVTPTSAEGLRLGIRTEALASGRPRVFRPTTAPAARNGQRIAVPASQVVTETVERPVGKVQLTVSSTAEPNRVVLGQPSRDRVAIGGALAGWNAPVAVRVYGPFRSAEEIRCTGAPAFEASFAANGPGTYTTPPATLGTVGWYTYRLDVPGDETHLGVTSPCAVPSESFRVEVQPRVSTVVSATKVQPGTTITDRIDVAGLGGETATIQASLYGPFSTREAIACTGTPFWSGTVQAVGDGQFTTAPVQLAIPGYYTYRETIAAAGFVRAAETKCGEVPETTVAVGAPRLTTRVSAQSTKPGATITDSVVVTGLGVLRVTVSAELFGPFATEGAIRCDGTPAWKGTVVATGDGTYTTPPVRLDRAGYYTYRESIAEGPANAAVQTECGETAETTLTRAVPQVTTLASAEVVVPGTQLHDRVRVSGLGKTSATVELELFGPFASREAVRCTGQPVWRGRFAVEGDGVHSSPSVRLERAGFYTYREQLVGTPLVEGTRGECAAVAETALARPLIVTGGRAVTKGSRAATDVGARTPVRVRVATLGIDAPVTPADIDTRAGVLDVSSDIRRLGWWADGAAPGDSTGAILVAGHVDSASKGPGAFFRLRSARPGTRVELRSRDGRVRAYRVVSVRAMRKEMLPLDVYSLRGPGRLVLVTCGGPFDRRSGHYLDNVVVTAVPV